MTLVQIISLIALAISLIALSFHLVRIIKLGKPKEYSTKTGNIKKAVLYSNTVAMMPNEKESAYLHLPSYTLGMLFHVGTFSSLLLYLLLFFNFFRNWLINDRFLHYLIVIFLLITTISGIFLFVKRLINKSLKALSNPDDYISNAITTLFQLFTLLVLAYPTSGGTVIFYYITATLLFLYMPLGKLKHLLYYFSARYHLGFFYGWRNVWPVKK